MAPSTIVNNSSSKGARRVVLKAIDPKTLSTGIKASHLANCRINRGSINTEQSSPSAKSTSSERKANGSITTSTNTNNTATTTTTTTATTATPPPATTTAAQRIRKKQTDPLFIRRKPGTKLNRAPESVVLAPIYNGLTRVHKATLEHIQPTKITERLAWVGKNQNSRGKATNFRQTLDRPSVAYVSSNAAAVVRPAFIDENTRLHNDVEFYAEVESPH